MIPYVPASQSPKKVGDDIKKATGDWKGQKVTVKLTVVNRQAAVTVVPSAAAWLIKALAQKFAAGQPKIHNGNLSLDQVLLCWIYYIENTILSK